MQNGRYAKWYYVARTLYNMTREGFNKRIVEFFLILKPWLVYMVIYIFKPIFYRVLINKDLLMKNVIEQISMLFGLQ